MIQCALPAMRDAASREPADLPSTTTLLRGAFAGKTLSRMMMHRLISQIVQGVPNGLVADLGATRTGSYASMLYDLEQRGVRTLTLSIDRDGRPDVACDLDRSIPLAARSTNLLLALNLLEHLRRPERFMAEFEWDRIVGRLRYGTLEPAASLSASGVS